MRVAKYWARAERTKNGYGRGAWGSSDNSLEEAQQAANQRAEALLAEVVAAKNPRLHEYEYQRHDLPEPILQDMQNRQGERFAAITLNRYGALVLNTSRLVFIDVDFESMSPGGGLIGRLFARKPADPAMAAIERLRTWINKENGRGARVYRTAAGLRYVLTSPAMDPAGDEVQRLMDRLGADPLYARLCRAQRSFRARLSPKPWRLGITNAPNLSYERIEDLPKPARKWLQSYKDACRHFAVCALIDEIGQTQPPNDETARLIATHDERAGVDKDLPLA